MKSCKSLFLAAFLLLVAGTAVSAQDLSCTYKVADRDTCSLYMDVYEPFPGSETTVDGKDKPTVLFVFGGGFVMGERSSEYHLPWFKLLNDNGYRVITVDYRLGLKGKHLDLRVTKLKESAQTVKDAVDIAVEDVFASVSYILENAGELGVDPGNIVIAGSSAGAMTALQAEWYICNGHPLAKVLPSGFNFAGLMSFAGAIMSNTGKPSFKKAPCPILLIHGTADRIVTYDKMSMGKWGMYGSSALAEFLSDRQYEYCIYRFKDHNHDMASNYVATWPEEKRFLEENVAKGRRRVVDAFVDDPAIPVFAEFGTLEDIYK